jgi:hypothetical protein
MLKTESPARNRVHEHSLYLGQRRNQGRNFLFAPGAIALVTALCVVVPSPVRAEVICWTGATGDEMWDTPCNWDPPQVPGPADDVVLPAVLCPPALGCPGGRGEASERAVVRVRRRGTRHVLTLTVQDTTVRGASGYLITGISSGDTVRIVAGGSIVIGSGNVVQGGFDGPNGPVDLVAQDDITVNPGATIEGTYVRLKAGSTKTISVQGIDLRASDGDFSEAHAEPLGTSQRGTISSLIRATSTFAYLEALGGTVDLTGNPIGVDVLLATGTNGFTRVTADTVSLDGGVMIEDVTEPDATVSTAPCPICFFNVPVMGAPGLAALALAFGSAGAVLLRRRKSTAA